MERVPVIDLAAPASDVAARIDEACRDVGFFVVTNHGVPSRLLADLDSVAREFFSLDESEKAEIAMEHGGSAWRGWFPLGGEFTSGVPDLKEGIYFGSERPASDRRPMHGPNLFPRRPAAMRAVVLEYLDAAESLARRIVGLMDRALDLGGQLSALVGDPLILFRIFAYPPHPAGDAEHWGVGEHTDYGLLTLLLQDGAGGLEVRTRSGWIGVDPLPGSFVCNIGDMLERATGGRWRSNPHRVRNPSDRLRLSFPFFFDPSFDARVRPFLEPRPSHRERWDGVDPMLFEGPYGDWVWAKVSRVFPELAERVAPG